MLSHKSCQQLKDAGFPQNKAKLSYVFPPKCPENYTNIMEVSKPQGRLNLLAAGYNIVACPSLEELIDELGDRFSELLNVSKIGYADKWEAVAFVPKKLLKSAVAITKKEAVAKLFIKLNKR